MRKFLIVDDDPTVLALLEKKLQDAFKCHITLSSGGYEALQLILECRFDMVISDLNMPEGTGLYLLDGLRAEEISIPLILFTAAPAEVVAPFLGAPLVAVITKPEVNALLSRVHENLEASVWAI